MSVQPSCKGAPVRPLYFALVVFLTETSDMFGARTRRIISPKVFLLAATLVMMFSWQYASGRGPKGVDDHSLWSSYG